MARKIIQFKGRSQPFQNKMLSSVRNVLRAKGTGDMQIGVDLKGRLQQRKLKR